MARVVRAVRRAPRAAESETDRRDSHMRVLAVTILMALAGDVSPSGCATP